jgi:hypothetical protein
MNIPASNSARTALKPTSWLIFRRTFVLTALALGSLALSFPVWVVLPPADAGYAGFNTAEGDDALFVSTALFCNSARFFLLERSEDNRNK